MSFFSKLFGNVHTQSVKRFEPFVGKINALEQSIQALSDAELKEKTVEFRRRLGVDLDPRLPASVGTGREDDTNESNNGTIGQEKNDNIGKIETLDDILPEAFAVVREASRRTLGQRHFDVQLLGGMVLNSGAIAEMRTGEGKTLVATLPAYLNALTGKGVHIVTVNDYLSRRDAVWMGQIYDFLGLTVGVINDNASFLYDKTVGRDLDPRLPASVGTGREDDTKGRGDGEVDSKLDKERDVTGGFKVVHEFLKPCTRREAYAADITYGTNNEFGFDYLRDNLEYSENSLRQKEFNYAIVDEIDSILIDEARTPLIISAPTRDAEAIYKQFASIVNTFLENEDYTVDEKRHGISLLPAGIEKAEKALNVDNIYTDAGIKYVHHLETAVRAKALYHRDKEYVVRDNAIVIVDEFTGRMQPGRRWSEGLHQAIEAKEGVNIQQESRTYASITFQNFFRMYPKLSGMTGTAATSGEEFFKVYGLEVYVLPTNKPISRNDRNDQIFRTEAGKFKAIANKVKELHDRGQPVLIGTVSIERNELLSQFLKAEGIPHKILNAKHHENEGEIIAQAGKKGAVTIATNMAGRGVDIKLGGNPNTPESYEEVKSLGGLFVLGTERHEARRIDNQLRGRSGRQGDPGETQFFVSLEDTLMRVFASDTMKSMMGRLGMPEDQPIEHRLITKALESAQEKIEGFNFDSRKHVLEFDDVINTQRTNIYGRRRKLLVGSIDDVEAELQEIIQSAPRPSQAATSVDFAKQTKTLRRAEEGAASPATGTANAKGNTDSHAEEGAADAQTSVIGDVIEKKISEFGRENFLNAVRIVLLQAIDMYWVEHLEVMDYTRSSVNLRAYGQRDPLVEYKKEGLRLFREMQNAMRDQVVRIIPNITPVPANTTVENRVANHSGQNNIQGNTEMKNTAKDAMNITANVPGNSALPRNDHKEIGRNDPCWCGSGKKYKKCHGK